MADERRICAFLIMQLWLLEDTRSYGGEGNIRSREWVHIIIVGFGNHLIVNTCSLWRWGEQSIAWMSAYNNCWLWQSLDREHLQQHTAIIECRGTCSNCWSAEAKYNVCAHFVRCSEYWRETVNNLNERMPIVVQRELFFVNMRMNERMWYAQLCALFIQNTERNRKSREWAHAIIVGSGSHLIVNTCSSMQ